MHQGPVSAYFEILRDEIPATFLQRLRQSQTFIYEESFGRSFLDIFPDAEARDLCGHLRRALSEMQLDKLATECGFPCVVHTNKKRSEHHRVVQIGRLYLTCSYVRSPQQKPRSAQYRKQAALSPLYAFPTFDFIPPLEQMKKDSIYVVVVHGADPRALNRPGFLSIGIPDPNWKEWLELTPIEYLLEAQALQRLVAERERITDRAEPKPKDKKTKKENDGK